MFNSKVIVAAAVVGFLLSFFTGIFSGVGFGFVVLRAIIFAAILALVAVGVFYIFEKFLDMETGRRIYWSLWALSSTFSQHRRCSRRSLCPCPVFLREHTIPSTDRRLSRRWACSPFRCWLFRTAMLQHQARLHTFCTA